MRRDRNDVECNGESIRERTIEWQEMWWESSESRDGRHTTQRMEITLVEKAEDVWSGNHNLSDGPSSTRGGPTESRIRAVGQQQARREGTFNGFMRLGGMGV